MSSLVKAYERLLLDNVSTVRSVESGIRNLTWLLPGRFEDAEVASEGLYALLSIVSSYHDTLLSRRIPKSLSLPPHPFVETETSTSEPSSSSKRVTPALPPPSDHARYTRYWTDKSKVYKRASRTLATLNYVELLIEMVVRRKGNDRVRWRVLLVIETIKTCLRLLIMGITRRPVLNPPIPQREFDITAIPVDLLSQATERKPSRMASSVHAEIAGGPTKTTPAVKAISPGAPLRSHLYPTSTALPEDHLAHPLTLIPEMTTSAFAAEMLTSTATLVHLLLLLRAQHLSLHPLRSTLPTLSTHFTPFLVPLAFRLLAQRLRPPAGDSLLLSSHYAALDRRMAYSFFLQGPMWVGWTRPKIMAVVKTIERIPLVGLAGELVEGYIPLVDEYFCYTSS